METGLIFQCLGVIIPLVAAWIVWTNKFTELKTEVANLKVTIEKMNTDRKELAAEMKEMKEVMQQVLLKLTKLETLSEMERKHNETKTK